MAEFERDFNKYLVIKTKDIKTYATLEDEVTLLSIALDINKNKVHDGKRLRRCVVIEDDWPEYEIVWKMIEDRVKKEEKPI